MERFMRMHDTPGLGRRYVNAEAAEGAKEKRREPASGYKTTNA